MRVLLRLGFLALLSGVLPRPALAVWPHSTTQNVPLNASGYYGYSVPDGAGGVIVAWAEFRVASYDIFAQHISATGAFLWGPGGVTVCNATNDQYLYGMVSDKNGGAILVWTDYRTGLGTSDIYAGRVTSSGTVPWGTSGVSLCSAAGNQYNPTVMEASSYYNSGAVVAWTDERAGQQDIYAVRVNINGVVQWALDGVVVCNAAGAQTAAQGVVDPLGAFAFVAWTDTRSGGYDIYYQRLSEFNGAAAYAANGIAVCNAAGDQFEPTVALDGGQNVYVAWTDTRSGGFDIWASLMTSGGSAYWALNGIAVCTAVNQQLAPRATAVGSGAVVIAWDDYRPASGYSDIYAQRLNGYGSAEWTANGIPVVTATGAQYNVAITSDASSNVFVAWRDHRDSPAVGDLYVQRIQPAGTLGWGNGVPVCTAPSTQYAERGALAADREGGVYVTFADTRDASQRNYSQRVDQWGILGGEPVIADVADVPNDQGGVVKVSWSASPLDVDPLFRNIADYRVYRSAPAFLARSLLATGGAHLEGEEGSGRTFVTTIQGANVYYWEYVATATAEHLATYSLLAPTAGDSVGGTNPTTAYMVRARTAGGAQWWDSAPDSGYSVDDLAPAAPAPFTGEYGAGSTALHWNPNAEADLAEYRLYRGTTPGFVPGPGNFVAAVGDTGYSDAAGAPYYYKIAAVDEHGNVSAYSLVAPSGTVDVPGRPEAALSMSRPAPNPVRDRASVRFTLPRATHARLSLHDVSGRCVRVLADGALSAGEHAVTWSVRDGSGSRLAAGLYWLRLEADGRALTTRTAVTP